MRFKADPSFQRKRPGAPIGAPRNLGFQPAPAFATRTQVPSAGRQCNRASCPRSPSSRLRTRGRRGGLQQRPALRTRGRRVRRLRARVPSGGSLSGRGRALNVLKSGGHAIVYATAETPRAAEASCSRPSTSAPAHSTPPRRSQVRSRIGSNTSSGRQSSATSPRRRQRRHAQESGATRSLRTGSRRVASSMASPKLDFCHRGPLKLSLEQLG